MDVREDDSVLCFVNHHVVVTTKIIEDKITCYSKQNPLAKYKIIVF